MSVEATRAVWRYSESTGTARLVLLAIADNADDGGIAWPGHKTIAEKCHISQRTVISNIARLNNISELGVIHRRNRGNIYRIVLPDVYENHEAHHQQAGYKCRFCTLLNVNPSVSNVKLGASYVKPSASYVKQGSHESLEPSLNHQEPRRDFKKAKCPKCKEPLDEDSYCAECRTVAKAS